MPDRETDRSEAGCVSCFEGEHDIDYHDHHSHGDRGDPYIGPPHSETDRSEAVAAALHEARRVEYPGARGPLAVEWRYLTDAERDGERRIADRILAALRPEREEAGLRGPALPLIDHAIDAIEQADNRAMAADGPVAKTTDELSAQDMRDVYNALKLARAALAAPVAGLDEVAMLREIADCARWVVAIPGHQLPEDWHHKRLRELLARLTADRTPETHGAECDHLACEGPPSHGTTLEPR